MKLQFYYLNSRNTLYPTPEKFLIVPSILHHNSFVRRPSAIISTIQLAQTTTRNSLVNHGTTIKISSHKNAKTRLWKMHDRSGPTPTRSIAHNGKAEDREAFVTDCKSATRPGLGPRRMKRFRAEGNFTLREKRSGRRRRDNVHIRQGEDECFFDTRVIKFPRHSKFAV